MEDHLQVVHPLNPENRIRVLVVVVLGVVMFPVQTGLMGL
jgi:hypothetical protein